MNLPYWSERLSRRSVSLAVTWWLRRRGLLHGLYCWVVAYSNATTPLPAPPANDRPITSRLYIGTEIASDSEIDFAPNALHALFQKCNLWVNFSSIWRIMLFGALQLFKGRGSKFLFSDYIVHVVLLYLSSPSSRLGVLPHQPTRRLSKLL